ncbi:acyl-CoA thioester hydrolase/BAAT C-terminal domain-containing protein [Eudoraea chungangensis]|uniref:acyl-CoA thioester hydrolase/BAAT C-terminal domain-containing protein n=1 Tax=Eudoraea chungangensis TaxID=1481905 RepID=UPI0023ED0445|nr:acyl-CoA thioester hydrolase/BAAT C-terminal domain-containing protein [Eudoraea chungangensis]
MKKIKKYALGVVVTTILFIAYLIIDLLLFDGVKSRQINENGLIGNYFAKEVTKPNTAIILVGGGEWGDYWAEEFAKKDLVGLSLPYALVQGLPKRPEEINLEYFANAIKWLAKQKEVDSKRIVVMGASRNAELSLLIASVFPELVGGVIAYAPSSVTWSNTVLPYNSEELKPSWKYQGVAIPFVPMQKIIGENSNKIVTIDYWKSGLAKTEYVAKAAIKVEDIKGPILLFSGKDDLVWPSALMADMIEQRLQENDFQYSFQNIQYEAAGHLISTNPDANSVLRTGIMIVDGKEYMFEYGGTKDGDWKAKKDAQRRLYEFLKKIPPKIPYNLK